MADYPTATYNARTVAELQALNLGGGSPTHAEYDIEVADEVEAVETDLRAAIADDPGATSIRTRLQGIDTDVTAVTNSAAATAAALTAHETDTTGIHGIADTSTLYRSGGTDVAVADGGTGASTAADARTNLGLGTIATQAANNVSITGGMIAGITDLAVADGGTGASTAAGARTNLDVDQAGTAATLLVAHTGDTSDAHDASAISILDSGANYSATDAEAALAEVMDAEQAHEANVTTAHNFDARLAELLTNSPDSLHTHAWFYDDLLKVPLTSTTVEGFDVVASGTGSIATGLVADTGAFGYWIVLCTALNDRVRIAKANLVGSTGQSREFTIEWRFSIQQDNDGSNAVTYRVGMLDGNGSADPTDGFYFQLTSADATWYAVSADAGSRSSVDTNIDTTDGGWHNYKIHNDGAGLATFYIDGVSVATRSAGSHQFPDDGDDYSPQFSMLQTLGSADMACWVDYVWFKTEISRGS